MSISQITDEALALPEEDKLALARKIVASIADPGESTITLEDGVRRLEDVFSGKVVPLTEEEFRQSLQE